MEVIYKLIRGIIVYELIISIIALNRIIEYMNMIHQSNIEDYYSISIFSSVAGFIDNLMFSKNTIELVCRTIVCITLIPLFIVLSIIQIIVYIIHCFNRQGL